MFKIKKISISTEKYQSYVEINLNINEGDFGYVFQIKYIDIAPFIVFVKNIISSTKSTINIGNSVLSCDKENFTVLYYFQTYLSITFENNVILRNTFRNLLDNLNSIKE